MVTVSGFRASQHTLDPLMSHSLLRVCIWKSLLGKDPGWCTWGTLAYLRVSFWCRKTFLSPSSAAEALCARDANTPFSPVGCLSWPERARVCLLCLLPRAVPYPLSQASETGVSAGPCQLSILNHAALSGDSWFWSPNGPKQKSYRVCSITFLWEQSSLA